MISTYQPVDHCMLAWPQTPTDHSQMDKSWPRSYPGHCLHLWNSPLQPLNHSQQCHCMHHQNHHRAGILVDCSCLICIGIAVNDEMVAVEDFIDVGNILGKSTFPRVVFPMLTFVWFWNLHGTCIFSPKRQQSLLWVSYTKRSISWPLPTNNHLAWHLKFQLSLYLKKRWISSPPYPVNNMIRHISSLPCNGNAISLLFKVC